MYVSLNSLMNLSFDGATMGARYMFADRQGINVDLGFNSKSNEAGGKIRKISAFSVSLGYINYPFQKGNVAMYLLPYVRFSSEKNASVSTEKNGLELGLGIGSEWWAFKNVSLAAQVSFGFNSETIKNTTSNTESKNSTVGFLGNGSGKFYLTFYF